MTREIPLITKQQILLHVKNELQKKMQIMNTNIMVYCLFAPSFASTVFATEKVQC